MIGQHHRWKHNKFRQRPRSLTKGERVLARSIDCFSKGPLALIITFGMVERKHQWRSAYFVDQGSCSSLRMVLTLPAVPDRCRDQRYQHHCAESSVPQRHVDMVAKAGFSMFSLEEEHDSRVPTTLATDHTRRELIDDELDRRILARRG